MNSQEPNFRDNPAQTGPYAQPVRWQAPRETPYITYGILILTVAVFVLQLGSKYLIGYDLPAYLGVKENTLIQGGEIWRLITPMFLHSTNMLLHIVFNMYALFAFGPGLERFYGHGRFLALYLLAGFTGNVLSFVFSPVASLGASTAVFGLVGAEAVFLYRNRQILGRQAQGALVNLLVIVMLNLFLGFSSSFIDNWGHIGGLLGGILFAWFGGPLLQIEGIYPYLSISDSRTKQESLLAGALIAFGFGAIALIAMF